MRTNRKERRKALQGRLVVTVNKLLARPDMVVCFDNAEGKIESVVCPTMAMRNRVRRIVYKGEPPKGLQCARIPMVALSFVHDEYLTPPSAPGE